MEFGKRLVVAFLLMASSAPVAAQTPPAPTAPAPTATAPAAPAPAPADSPPAAPPPASPTVQVAQLAQLDLFSAGRDAGLGVDLWKGSSADITRALIPALARRPLSPAGAGLALRLLSQSAAAPDGAGADAQLAAARVAALLALGDAAVVDQIADRTPDLASSAALSEAAAEAALITDQNAKACAISDALAVDRDRVYWLRLRAFCQQLAGKTDAAQLTLTLASQQASDPVYTRLMGVLIAGGGDPGPPSLRNGLEYALSRQLKLDLEPAKPQASAAIAAHLAASTPPPLPPTPTPVVPPAPASASPPPMPSEADLLALLRQADTLTRFVAASKSAAPAIATLAQTKVALANPVQMATAALAAGDLPTAQAIVDALSPVPPADASPLDRAILDATLAAAAGKSDQAVLKRLAELASGAAGQDRVRAQAAEASFAGLIEPTDPDVRASLFQLDLGRNEAPAARLTAMDVAAAASLRGETALLALATAQVAGAAGPKPADRARIVRALRLAGLGDDARAFAVEGLIAVQSR